MIVVKDISKKFDKFVAVDNVSFELDKGVVALLGCNGAGKTTIIRMVSGYIEPSQGSISICGYNIIENRAEALKNVSYVPENNPLYGDMSVYEFIEYVSKIYYVSQEDFKLRLKKLANELEIIDVISKKIQTLSKGYKRRVAIVAALIHEPQVLILDEPTDGLDPSQKILIRSFLKEYAKDKLVLISTHIMEDVEIMADRILLINDGKLLKDASLEEIKKTVKSNNLIDVFSKGYEA